jgi:hypothetical protein
VKAVGWGGGYGEVRALLCYKCGVIGWADLEANAVFEAGIRKDLLNG